MNPPMRGATSFNASVQLRMLRLPGDSRQRAQTGTGSGHWARGGVWGTLGRWDAGGRWGIVEARPPAPRLRETLERRNELPAW